MRKMINPRQVNLTMFYFFYCLMICSVNKVNKDYSDIIKKFKMNLELDNFNKSNKSRYMN